MSPPRPLQALAPAPELLLAVAEVGHELAAHADLNLRLRQVLRVLERRLGAARSALYVVDQERRSIGIQAQHGVGPEQFRPRYGFGVVGRVAQSDQPVVVPVVRHDPMALSELSDLTQWQGIGWNLVAVPITSSGRSIGVLSTYYRHRDPAGFAERLGVLDVVAGLIAKALRGSKAPPLLSSVLPDRNVPAPREKSADMSFDYSNMIGASAVMRQVYEQVGQVARTNATTLLRGESGTGKELVARAIHHNSARAALPFVKVNCAALPEPLFESELFGHERGAFTGAHSRKKGRFELAEGGTLFLDEIGELALATQAKLLRVLQFREFERLGGTQTLRTDVRIVAATNKDMERAIREGTFREDLYYRLDIFTITLPPLRDRRTDIPTLAEYFLGKYAGAHQCKVGHIASGAMDLLTQHSWPGNVRELENVIERAVVVCNGGVIQEHHLPQSIQAAERAPVRPTLTEAVEQLERQMIEQTLREQSGSIAATARELGTTERIVRYKAQKLGIDPARFRS